jgi:2',3'-cyclic-nucleotide 2'-phosphodiesterase/3'-nucleotidase/5'-nucleotidase
MARHARSFAVALLLGAACAPRAQQPVPPPAPVPVIPQPEQPPADAPAVELVLMGTTDVHGRLYPYDYYTGETTAYGLGLLKPIADSVRGANAGRTFLFDSGDLLQGNPLAFVYARMQATQSSPIVKAMELLDYDAAAIGNHEFNYGLEHLGRAVEQADFPFVSANIFRHGTTEHAYSPYVLLPHATGHGDTILIGVTGNTPPGVHLWDRANVEGTLEFRDVVASLKPVVAEMRERGADLVVVLSHGGFEGTSYDTAATGLPPENAAARVAREIPGVDVIFLGHTHRELGDSMIAGPSGPVLFTQAGHWARSLAVATLELHRRAPGDWAVTARRARVIRPDPQRTARTFLDSLRWEHERTVAWVNARIGRAPAEMSAREARVRDTPIIDFINEVQRAAGNADLSSTAAFRIEAGLDTGAITIAEIAGLYPYDNTLQVIRITGEQLKQYLEKSAEYYRGWPGPDGGPVTDPAVPGYNFDIVSGVEYAIDISRPKGQRVAGLTHRGQPVRAEQTFTLALNNYRASGGGGYTMIRGAPVVLDRQQDIRELLIEEVRRRGTLRPEDFFRESWRLLPGDAARAAAAEQARTEAPAAVPDTIRPRKRLRVLMTNDFHGRLQPETPSWAEGREAGGAALLASYFAAEAEGFGGPTVLLDGGDLMQGTPVSNLTRGRSTIEYYNTIGYDAAAIGNHEFDWTIAVLRERIADARFPWLSANIVVAGTDTAPSWARPTAILDFDGVRIGIIGLTTESTPYTTKPSNVRTLEFRSGAATIDRWVPELRRQGVDFVIVVTHAGAICQAEVRDCRGEIVEWAEAITNKPDLIVGGHAHQVVRTRENDIPIIQAGSYSTRYGVVDLERVSDDSVDVWIRGTPAAWSGVVKPDSVIAALVERWVREIGPEVNRVITTLDEPLRRGVGEYALGRLIADAQRAATDADVAIMNNGGIRTNVEAGQVTWGELFQVQPFGNLLVKLQLTGAQLRTALEHVVRGAVPGSQVSGIVVDFDPQAPPGSRIRSMRLSDGAAVRDDSLYTVTVNDFMAEGGDGFEIFTQAAARDDTGIVDLDALIEYLGRLPRPLTAPAEPRLRATGGGGAADGAHE